MNRIPTILVFIVCRCPFFIQMAMSQDLVLDTLTVSFNQIETSLPPDVSLNTVVDERDRPGKYISLYETNKYVFIPVDLLIQAPQPLSMEIKNMFQTETEHNTVHNLEMIVKDFRISKKSSPTFTSRYQLNSTLQFREKTGNEDPELIGELVYETVYNGPLFGDKLQLGFTQVIHRWQNVMSSDVRHLAEDLLNSSCCGLPNYRSESFTNNYKNLIGIFNTFFAPDLWMFDIHIFFSDREATPWFFRKGGQYLRYRNENDFEAIEYSLSVDQWFYRMHPKWLLLLKSNMMFGLNRWNNIMTTRHKLYDTVIFDYSFSQMFQYNPLDCKGIIFGMGLMEGITYIYSKGYQFQYALSLQLGIKL
jgi:hypothetical protein